MTPPQHQSSQARSSPPTGLELITRNRILLLLWNAYNQRVTPAGRWLIGPTFLFGLWGPTTLEHEIHIACLYALAVWGAAFLCLPFVRPRVRLAAGGGDRAGAGETLAVEIEITPAARWAGTDLFVVPHQPQAGIETVPPEGVRVPPLTPGQTVRVTLPLRFPKRGVYALRGFRVASDFPFGLLCAYRVFGPPRRVLVFPRFTPLTRLAIASGRRYHPGGVVLASNLGESFEYVGNRPFREGDNVRDIDWSATARLDDLIVREYRQEYFHRVAIVMDTQAVGAAALADFERAVSLAASVSDFMARQEYLVDLFAAGPDVYHLTAGRSLAYVDEILEILACVQASGREPFAALEPEIDETLAQITTIVCLFLDWNEARRAFVERLGRDGAALKTIIVRDLPPTLAPDTDAVSIVSSNYFSRGSPTYDESQPPRVVPPWPATAAGLVAMATLFLSSGPTPVLPILAVALLAVYLFGAQFDLGTRPIQITRLLVFGTIFALRGEHDTNLMDAWGPAQSLDTIAQVAAAELVIRAWQRGPGGGARRMLLFSGLVMLIGCSTDNQALIMAAAPLYFLCVILALRADRPHKTRLPLRETLSAFGLIALTLALGAVVTRQFETHKSDIMEWGMEALGERARPPDTGASVTGLSKTPILGSTFNQPGSSARLLKIEGVLNDPYLHQMAFDDYHSGSWRPDFSQRVFIPADLASSRPGPRARVTRYVNDDGCLSAPLSCAGINTGGRGTLTWDADGGPVRLEPDDVLTYDIIHGPSDDFQGPLCVPPTPAETARCLQIPPEVDPRVRAISRRIAAQDSDPRLRVQDVVRFLMRNNAYSLSTQRGRGDPVSEFILQGKAAHCEYFASAAVILLRGAGVPTRYAIGYYAHEGSGPGVTVVRAQDAHAWAESWITGVGWVVVDATPGNGRPDRTGKSAWWWKWRDRWQDMTLAFRVWVTGLSAGQRLALFGGLAAVLLASSLLRRRQRRRRNSDFTYAVPSEALGNLAGRFEAYLARRGHACPPDRPWQEHLAMPVPSDNAEPTPSFDRERAQAFVRTYNQVRFGDSEAAGAVATLQETLRQMETRQ